MDFSDVNPPVHAWAVYGSIRLNKMYGRAETISGTGICSCYSTLLGGLIVRDVEGKNIFQGGFSAWIILVFRPYSQLPTGINKRMARVGNVFLEYADNCLRT